ncbi:hypothetical protein [Hankyongella ginsenosidimutans]|uniref:hypothetical protein n=1 Tax=Hankyongella ginsenosidimutans TaxID=1763828 RepID=UPI001CA36EC0|nr:hypothetical protein [Hankyongella ginsenosidimutans]
MALGMLLSPIGTSTSHNPVALAAAEAARHAELAAQIEAHGHSHDDGEADERSPGHSHGHNPADHSHETASTLPDFTQPVPPIGRRWLDYPPSVAALETLFRLERPPRPILLA